MTPESTNRVKLAVVSQLVNHLDTTGWISITEPPMQLGVQQSTANLLQQGWQVAPVQPMTAVSSTQLPVEVSKCHHLSLWRHLSL
ncbi:MAG: hypothetical protein AB2693_21400 [Candidatus Thiodiazotropha sp.]